MENTSNKGLMKKTKAELIDIILRKDDVERRLREEVTSLNESINKNVQTIAEQADYITTLNGRIDEFEGQADIAATDLCEVYNKYYAMKSINAFLSLIIAMGVIALLTIVF